MKSIHVISIKAGKTLERSRSPQTLELSVFEKDDGVVSSRPGAFLRYWRIWNSADLETVHLDAQMLSFGSALECLTLQLGSTIPGRTLPQATTCMFISMSQHQPFHICPPVLVPQRSDLHACSRAHRPSLNSSKVCAFTRFSAYFLR